jgi:hypothetical protein
LFSSSDPGSSIVVGYFCTREVGSQIECDYLKLCFWSRHELLEHTFNYKFCKEVGSQNGCSFVGRWDLKKSREVRSQNNGCSFGQRGGISKTWLLFWSREELLAKLESRDEENAVET